jgi:hypothetical protein
MIQRRLRSQWRRMTCLWRNCRVCRCSVLRLLGLRMYCVDVLGCRSSIRGGDDTAHAQAQKIGLERSTSQSLDTVGDTAISWTLGMMALETVRVGFDQPLADPLDDITDDTHSPIKLIHPPTLYFSSIKERHMPSLAKYSLGFSLVAFLFYGVIICA